MAEKINLCRSVHSSSLLVVRERMLVVLGTNVVTIFVHGVVGGEPLKVSLLDVFSICIFDATVDKESGK